MNAITADLAEISPAELDERLAQHPNDAIAWRGLLNDIREAQFEAFRDGTPASDLIPRYTAVVDHMLIAAWEQLVPKDAPAALVAVGGYGRSELLPRSDIDLLILYQDGHIETLEAGIGQFVTYAWDMGLEIGHSVRSPEECAKEALADITVVTNLMESRRLVGDEALYTAMQATISVDKVWSDQEFFLAKTAEQVQRYKQYDDTAYKLEPNTKEGPGGLRDIQVIGWVTQRHYGTAGLEELHARGLLRANEISHLISGRAFLWQVRFALHMLTNRAEDRLLFDHQLKVGELFGYKDKTHNLAVEQFMQLYYRTIKGLSVLNDIFLQLMEEEIFLRKQDDQRQALNEHFQLRHGFIECREADLFEQRPLALLEIFKVWAENEHLKIRGISADTLRLIRGHRNRIKVIRDTREARSIFMDMLRMERGVLHSLRRMNRYGILGRYIPAFGHIIGRMQYDLFHTLTVDEHTLFVVRNMRRLAVPEFRHEFPVLSALHDDLRKPELLYLAGLFHDIAKGREGDHSELGEADAREFCLSHGLSSQDSETVAWLVRNHLLMSMTAQRKDVSDPDEINTFATKVGSRERLDLIYLLTVCDIRATNPKLWNGFREGLLNTLYSSTRRVLERGDPMASSELVAETRQAASLHCFESGLSEDQIKPVWARFDDDYFLKHSSEEVAWHTQAIINAQVGKPSVLVRHFPNRGTAVLVYMPDAARLFSTTSSCLAQLGLSILDARIHSTNDDYVLDTFIVGEAHGKEIVDPERRQEIGSKLAEALENPHAPIPKVGRRITQRQRHFTTPVQIYFTPDNAHRQTLMELVADDRPGLLAAIGLVFDEMAVQLRAAKIGTIGERAEDVFFLSDTKGQALSDPALLHELRERVTDQINLVTDA
ncbi:MAG: [protein-PII] uridylyltransferase [Oceanococcus sp.]